MCNLSIQNLTIRGNGEEGRGEWGIFRIACHMARAKRAHTALLDARKEGTPEQGESLELLG